MAQTPSKTVAAKKTAALPKSMPKSMPKPKKAVAAKKTNSKEETKKAASPKAVAKKEVSKPVVKKVSTRAPTASVKSDGEIVKAKKAKKAASTSAAVTPEQRYRMICDAAYFRAEQRGFIGGSPEQDWREAELEIDQRLCDMQEAQQNH
jgi:outer membrane biosynthesis protein TonB